MLSFDKLKIVSAIDYISIIDEKAFLKQSIGRNIISWKYEQKNPYNVCIIKNCRHHELSIEFTGKLLKDEYCNLINQTNIRKCFEEINCLGICILDIEAILCDSEVVKCDVTKDICGVNIEELSSYMERHLCNYKKWHIKNMPNGFVLENSSVTPRNKKRLTIYNKFRELKRATNSDFLSNLLDSKALMDYFKDKIRFELNIKTKKLIQKLLDVPNNMLTVVLASTANPFLSILQETISPMVGTNVSNSLPNLQAYLRYLLLQKCDFDMKRVEAEIRSWSSKSTSIPRAISPYRQILENLQIMPVSQWENLLEMLS